MPYSSVVINLSRDKVSTLDFLEGVSVPIKCKNTISNAAKEITRFYSGKMLIEEDLQELPKINQIVSDNLKIHIQGHPRDTSRLLLLIAWATNATTREELLKLAREKNE